MDFLKGSASSAMAYTIVYPIDVVKVQYQCQVTTVKFSAQELIRNIIKEQGVKGFYKGYCANLFTYPIFWGAYFESSKYLNFNPVMNTFVAACIGSAISNPFFVAKVRCQTEILKGKKYNYRSLAHNIYRNEGMLGFFKGYPMTAINNTKLCIQMPLAKYLELKITDKKNDSSMTKNLKVGSGAAVAKLSTSLITYPCDLIRNIQRDTESKLKMFKLMERIYKTSGVPGFYRGMILYTAVTLPNFVLMMMIKSKLDK